MKRAPVPIGALRPGQRSIIILFLLILHDRKYAQPRQYDLARVRDATDLGCDRAAKRTRTVLWPWRQGQMGTRRARRAPGPLTVNTVLESLYPIRLRPHSKFFDLSYFTRSTVTHWQRMGREEGQEVGLRSEGEQRVRRKGETGER
jgi:hypothetical protein